MYHFKSDDSRDCSGDDKRGNSGRDDTVIPMKNGEVCKYAYTEPTREKIFKEYIQDIIECSANIDHEILYFPFTGRIEYNQIRGNRIQNVDFVKDVLLATDPKTDEYFTRVLRINRQCGQIMDTIGDMMCKIEKSRAADKSKRMEQSKEHSKPEWYQRIEQW